MISIEPAIAAPAAEDLGDLDLVPGHSMDRAEVPNAQAVEDDAPVPPAILDVRLRAGTERILLQRREVPSQPPPIPVVQRPEERERLVG